MLSLTVAACVLASGQVPAGAAEVPTSVEPMDAQQADTEAEARVIAAAHDHDVVVGDQSSPNLLVKARPDGLMEAVSSQIPEQAEVDGTWQAIETTLVEKAEWFEPKVASVQVHVGKGGDSNIVSVRSASGEWVSETWPYGELPAPVVSKSTALFKDVLPDVDLRVAATKAGMREVLIIKSAAAAEDERVKQLRVTIEGARLEVAPETDTLRAHPNSGEPVVAATPLWWDSSHESASADSPGGVEVQAVDASVQGSQAVLDVGAVTDQEVTYPVFVDPDWSGSYLQYDWYTDRAYPNQSYLNPPENSVGYGIENGVSYLSRAFYRFDTAWLAGKVVADAHFNVVQNWANSCASTWTQLWQYGGSSVGFTWNTDPGQWVRILDQQGFNTGGPCSPNPGWVGFSAKLTAQDAATYSAPFITLGLRTADETNALSRKHFRWDAKLDVTYNSRPNVPTGAAMTAPSRGCSTDPANPSYVSGGQPLTLQVQATDPDPGNVAANFYLSDTVTGTERLLTTTPLQAQNAVLQTTIDKNTLVDGRKYAWSAQSSDYLQVSARTAACYFVVDSTKPPLPTLSVTSAGHTDPMNATVWLADNAVGAPMTIHLAPATGSVDPIGGYQLWWVPTGWTVSSPPPPVTDYTGTLPSCDGSGQPVMVACAGAAGDADVTVAAPAFMATLWVAAYDRAGNVSFQISSNSAATGQEVRSSSPADLSASTIWRPLDAATVISPEVGSATLNLGSNLGWSPSGAEETAQFQTPALVTLDRLVRGGVGHWTNSSVYEFPGGYGLQVITGQIGRLETGQAAPAGTLPLYACAYGAGNFPSTSSTCEGATTKPNTLLGYTWASAANVPAGFSPVQIYRCRIGVDYFLSTESPCEGGVNEGSRGFVARVAATVSSGDVVDTTKSFSVAARIRIDAKSGVGSQTVLGTTASTQSAFFLQAAGGKWRFCVRAQGPTQGGGCATGPDVTDRTFVTVIGSWDAINGIVSVAVLTDQTGAVPYFTYVKMPADNIRSSGVLTVGSAIYRGMPADFFGGSVAAVGVYPGLLTDTQMLTSPLPMP